MTQSENLTNSQKWWFKLNQSYNLLIVVKLDWLLTDIVLYNMRDSWSLSKHLYLHSGKLQGRIVISVYIFKIRISQVPSWNQSWTKLLDTTNTQHTMSATTSTWTWRHSLLLTSLTSRWSMERLMTTCIQTTTCTPLTEHPGLCWTACSAPWWIFWPLTNFRDNSRW